MFSFFFFACAPQVPAVPHPTPYPSQVTKELLTGHTITAQKPCKNTSYLSTIHNKGNYGLVYNAFA